MKQQTVYLSLGSNLGDSQATLATAVAALAAHPAIAVIAASRFYDTAPMYVEDQPRFCNQAVALETALEPLVLLDVLQAIEHQAGRVRTVRHGARTLDMDMIYYGTLCMTHPRLTVPHPLRLERLFVLEPLAEIAPDFRDPLTGQPMTALVHAMRAATMMPPPADAAVK